MPAAAERLDAVSYTISELNAVKASLGAAFANVKFHVRTLVLDSALTDADGSQAIDISADDAGASFPAQARLLGAGVLVKVPIGGTDISALTVTIGDAGAATELMTATDLFGDATNSWSTAAGAATFGQLEASAYVPVATFASTGGDVAAVTGTVICVIAYHTMQNPFSDGAPAGLVT